MIKLISIIKKISSQVKPQIWASCLLTVIFSLQLILPSSTGALAQDRDINDYQFLALESLAGPNISVIESDEGKSSIFQNDIFAQSICSPGEACYFDVNKETEVPSYQTVAVKRVIVTAYSSTSDQTDASPFITANGTYVYDGIVACNFLPFGTKVKLPEFSGDKIYTVEDRMARRNSYKLDIWMSTRSAALQFGVQRLAVEIVK